MEMTDFEKNHPDLHEFFVAGGQVHLYPETPENQRKGINSTVIVPFEDFPLKHSEEDLLSEAKYCTTDEFPCCSVDALSKRLDITYRAAIQLVNMAEVGGIRTTKGYKVYLPSIPAYLKRLQKRRNRKWYDTQ